MTRTTHVKSHVRGANLSDPSLKRESIERDYPVVEEMSFQQFSKEQKGKFTIVATGAGGDPVKFMKDIDASLSDAHITPGNATHVFVRAGRLTGNVRGSKGRTDLVFYMNPEVEFDITKMVIWRLNTAPFIKWGGDFVTNYKGDYR